MSIAADLLRGNTDMIILSHLLKGDSYGYEINKAIARKTGGAYELKEATLYTAFRRLEQNGEIASFWGDETTGARRRYYKLTEKGRSHFEELVRDWEEAKKLIDQVMKEEN